LPRQDVVHKQRRRLGHAPAAATRAKPAALTAECDELLGLARLALDPEKSVLESAALQIRFELVFDVARQRPLLGCPPIPEGRIVLGDEPISANTGDSPLQSVRRPAN
jgi:hypothetical protein